MDPVCFHCQQRPHAGISYTLLCIRSRCTFVGTCRTGSQDGTLSPEVSLKTQSLPSVWIDSAILSNGVKTKNGRALKGQRESKYWVPATIRRQRGCFRAVSSTTYHLENLPSGCIGHHFDLLSSSTKRLLEVTKGVYSSGLLPESLRLAVWLGESQAANKKISWARGRLCRVRLLLDSEWHRRDDVQMSPASFNRYLKAKAPHGSDVDFDGRLLNLVPL
jgi:hypothetical protein